MTTARAAVTALVFVWLGMVLAISFLEAPLKFRAPNVTLPIGLGIGRLVFRALNGIEAVFAAAILVTALACALDGATRGAVIAAAAVLLVQLLVVRPRLTRRSDAVLAGLDAPRSHSHLAYIALETLKAAALVTAGALALANTPT